MKVHIYTDGGSRGNPGPGASAFIARSGEPRRTIAERSRYVGRCTNNEAEYSALILGLEWANSRGFTRLELHSDSELMVNQINGSYKVRSPRIKPLFDKVVSLLKEKDWSIKHHRRDHPWISRCDEMVNEVLDQRKYTGSG